MVEAVTDDLHLFTEDGTEYVLPADFFAGPLKPGTRGTWKGFSIDDWHGTVVVGRPDRYGRIVVEYREGGYNLPLVEDFIPEVKPEPPTTVMVEMSVEDAGWAVHPVRGVSWAEEVAHQSRIERLQTAAAEALKKAGLK